MEEAAFEIGFFERSSRISDGDLAFIVAACNRQMVEHLAPAYGLAPWTCTAYHEIPAGAPTPIVPIRVLDDVMEEGALGFHTSFLGMPWGRVEAPTNRLDGTTFAHEAIEARLDPGVDKWVRMPDGREMAYEACDPCQRGAYTMDVVIGIRTRFLLVSDFVLPSYWQADGRAPFTMCEKLTGAATIDRPFGLAPGGYAIVREPGQEPVSIFAEDDDTAAAAVAHRKAEQLSRTFRRGFRGALEPLSGRRP